MAAKIRDSVNFSEVLVVLTTQGVQNLPQITLISYLKIKEKKDFPFPSKFRMAAEIQKRLNLQRSYNSSPWYPGGPKLPKLAGLVFCGER